jgi:hypothetical protein
MGEPLIFILCLISLLLSVISLYVSLRVAKNLQATHKNVETLHQALLAVLQPQAHGGQYIIHYIDDEYYEEELPENAFGPEDTVIDLFSRQALEWDSELEEWIPKIPENQEDN